MSQSIVPRALLRCAQLGALALALACGADDTTTGRPVELRTELRAEPVPSQPFTTQTGWHVRLSRAEISIGSLYYFDGEPAFAARRAPSLRERLSTLSWVAVARAHPGHYTAGNAMGQMTSPVSVDLLAEVSALPPGMGVSGTYRSGRFVWGAALDGKVALVEGVAEKEAQTIHFRLVAGLAEVARSASQGQVDGCRLDEARVESDGRITLRIDPRVWFKLVDFRGVAPGSPEAPTEIGAGETPQIAFALGLAQRSAYHFSYDP